LIHLPLSSIGTVAPPLTSIGGIVGEHLYHESPFLSASIPPGKKQQNNNKTTKTNKTNKHKKVLRGPVLKPAQSHV
jgi:hypothetical protein